MSAAASPINNWTDDDWDGRFVTIEPGNFHGHRPVVVIRHIAHQAKIAASFDTEREARRHVRTQFAEWPVRPAGTRQDAR